MTGETGVAGIDVHQMLFPGRGVGVSGKPGGAQMADVALSGGGAMGLRQVMAAGAFSQDFVMGHGRRRGIGACGMTCLATVAAGGVASGFAAVQIRGEQPVAAAVAGGATVTDIGGVRGEGEGR